MEVTFEHVRRIVVEHLTEPRHHDEQRLERLGRQRIDGERRSVLLDEPTTAGRCRATRSAGTPA